MTSYADDFTLLASAPSFVEAEARAKHLCPILVRWADGKHRLLRGPPPPPIAPQKSSLSLFTSPDSTLKCESAMQRLRWTERGCHAGDPLHLRPSCPRLCRAGFNGPQYHETLSRVELGLHNRNIGGRIQGHRAPHLQLRRPIWFTHISSTHLDKLEVIQNKALRIATGCHQKAGASHLRVETGVLPLRANLELCIHQFYASALQPLHPSHLIVASLPLSRSPPPQDYPRGLIPPHPQRPAS